MRLSYHNAYQSLMGIVSSCEVSVDGIIRVEVDCPLTSLSHWLMQQRGQSRYYWSNRERNFEMAAIGESDALQSSSQTEISKTLETIREKISERSGRIRYYGGCRFNAPRTDNDRWHNFKAYRFVLPLLELCRSGDRYFWACNVNGICNRNEVLKTLNGINHEGSMGSLPFPEFSDRIDLPDLPAWKCLVSKALHDISENEIQKVVLARQSTFRANCVIDPVALMFQIGDAPENLYRFCFEPTPGRAFLGASPERLYQREKDKIYSEALAGTRSRSDDPICDDLLKKELLNSDKELLEHQIVLHEICSVLRNYCVDIEYAATPEILELTGCQHLHTPITAILKAGNSDTLLLDALHPTPAVGGFPKDKALRWIQKEEPFERGIYAAPVGWIGADASEFCVGIRSGLVLDDTLTLYSGAGIVAGSDPVEEWNELNAKLAAFLKVMNKE
jgi:menaquinone-specific isochorismate synthase